MGSADGSASGASSRPGPRTSARWQAHQSGRFSRDAVVTADVPGVLLVEDNPGDVELTKRALAHGQLMEHLRVARDGAEALTALRDRDADSHVGLVLLDLNLPGMSGFEVLREIKTDARLRRIPVIVLTTSTRRADVDRAYELGAASYVVKPVELARYVEVMGTIEQYWIHTVKLP